MIEQGTIQQARSRLAKRLAATLINGMAATDTDLKTIAKRTRHSEEKLRDRLNALIDGRGSGAWSLDFIAEFSVAAGFDLHFQISPLPSEKGNTDG